MIAVAQKFPKESPDTRLAVVAFPQETEWKKAAQLFTELAQHILKNGKGKKIRIVRVDKEKHVGRKEIYGMIEKHEFHETKNAIKLHVKTDTQETEFFTLPLVAEFEPHWWGNSAYIKIKYE